MKNFKQQTQRRTAYFARFRDSEARVVTIFDGPGARFSTDDAVRDDGAGRSFLSEIIIQNFSTVSGIISPPKIVVSF